MEQRKIPQATGSISCYIYKFCRCKAGKLNRESGFGRYDVVLVPREKGRDAVVMEFKVFDDSEESGLEDTVAAALRQIDEKNYDTQLLDRGIPEKNIKHYGFAFCGKKVLIGC